MEQRITVNERQLSAAIAGWLRKLPPKVWEKWIEHSILAHYKRSSRELAHMESELAQHIASEMARLDWEVTHPAPRPLGSPPPWRPD